MKIPIEISARHAHLTAEDWQALFGIPEPTVDRTISQVPQFVANERVSLIGPRGEIPDVALVGPWRPYTQVELSVSDARRIGLFPPLTDSGQLDRASKISLVGPAGRIVRSAAIIQRRHLHASPAQAKQLGVKAGQEISLCIEGERGGTLEHVLVRIDLKFTLVLHLDTDEANAFGISNASYATIV